jgi:hypothetical protein
LAEISMSPAPVKAFEQLSRNRLFEGIGEKSSRKNPADVNILQLKRGDIVFKEGDLGDSLYWLAKAQSRFPNNAEAAVRKCSITFKPETSLAKMRF